MGLGSYLHSHDAIDRANSPLLLAANATAFDQSESTLRQNCTAWLSVTTRWTASSHRQIRHSVEAMVAPLLTQCYRRLATMEAEICREAQQIDNIGVLDFHKRHDQKVGANAPSAFSRLT
jgi:hypothetical protein